ncbi:MAG: hypothetical protein JO170_33605 [Verrucomicrobia bacterium]|nr:hypothetical protein [Verrucomicrobiota bacterium]
MKRLVAIAIAPLLAACTTMTTPAEIAAADYGPPPAADYEQQIKNYMLGVLKDPMSAQYIFSTPAKGGVVHDVAIAGGKPHFYWEVDVKINGKNSYGAYTGFQQYAFWFHNGKLMVGVGPDGIGFGPNGESVPVIP